MFHCQSAEQNPGEGRLQTPRAPWLFLLPVRIPTLCSGDIPHAWGKNNSCAERQSLERAQDEAREGSSRF